MFCCVFVKKIQDQIGMQEYPTLDVLETCSGNRVVFLYCCRRPVSEVEVAGWGWVRATVQRTILDSSPPLDTKLNRYTFSTIAYH